MSCQQEELACRIPFSFQPCQKYTPAPVGEMKPKEEPRRKGTVKENKETNQVAIAVGVHLFPSRTEKLSPRAPMVLLRNAGE